jgi:CheY-like chemotaxis protein
MSKRVLLIEADSRLSGALSGALEEAGFEVRVAGDGGEGIDAAHDFQPAAIVLAAELPGTSGYLVCQKIKKDDVLKEIPLVLTSAEATAETFEKHKQLKVRAQAYLLKPFAPDRLVDSLVELVGPPGRGAGRGAGGSDEEVVSLEEEMGLEGLGGTVDDLPAFDLQSLPDEPAPAAGGQDEDLRLLDDAFDSLAAPGAVTEEGDESVGERPGRAEDLDAAAASFPDEEEPRARDDISALEEEADRALGVLTADEGAEEAGEPPTPPSPDLRSTRTTIRGASADLLRAAGIPLMSDAPSRAGAAPGPARERERPGGDEEGRKHRERADDLARKLDEARLEADEARAERRKAEAELARAEERARAAEAEAEEARRGAEEAAEAMSRAETLRSRVDELEAELEAARREVEGARAESDRRTEQIRARLQEIEAAAAKNEERVLKAYQKIKGDERLREKIRKALAVALQLLDEGAPAESAVEKKIGSVLGRD